MTTITADATEEKPAVSWAERIAPSIPALFFVFLVVFVALSDQRQLLNSDGDLARHIRHGLYMMQHHALIRNDPFSFTRPGDPFVPFEYGSQLIYASVYLISGLAGVTIFAAALIAATYALFSRLLLKRGVDPVLTVMATMCAITLGAIHWLARPHLISWLIIVILFGMIETKRRPSLWMFPLFFAVWANLHGGWLYGIALLGIYAVGHFVQYWIFSRDPQELSASRYFASALLVSGVATLVTPMGFGLWQHLYSHLTDSYVFNHTGEFISPNFHPIAYKIVLAIILAALTAIVVSRRRMHPARLLVVLAGIWWSLTAQRNIPLFGLTGLTVVALHMNQEWTEIPWTWLKRVRNGVAAGAAKANTTGWIAISALLIASLAASRGRVLGQPVIANEFDAKTFPIEAVAKARSAGVSGRIFADFSWGGYLLFAWPEQRVFIDGGTDFYRSPVMRDYEEISSLDPGWRAVLDRRYIDLVLTRSHSKLARELVRTPGWSMSYCDSIAVMIRRDSLREATDPSAREAALAKCAGPDPDSEELPAGS
jgi:hypothetical protein